MRFARAFLEDKEVNLALPCEGHFLPSSSSIAIRRSGKKSVQLFRRRRRMSRVMKCAPRSLDNNGHDIARIEDRREEGLAFAPRPSGAFTYDVCKIFGILDPFPLVCILDQFIVLNSRNLPYYT